VLTNQVLIGDPTAEDSCGVESQVVGSSRPQLFMWSLSARPFSKFTICFLDIHSHAFGFALGMKSQSVVYLLRRREQIY
jgi:hypothetical protein